MPSGHCRGERGPAEGPDVILPEIAALAGYGMIADSENRSALHAEKPGEDEHAGGLDIHAEDAEFFPKLHPPVGLLIENSARRGITASRIEGRSRKGEAAYRAEAFFFRCPGKLPR